MNSNLAFSPQEFQRRNQLVEAAMAKQGIDVLIAYSVKNDPGSVVYLSGFEPSLGLHDVAFWLVAPGNRPGYALLTNAFWDHPAERTWVEEVLVTNQFGSRLTELVPGSAKRIGIAGYTFFPAPVYMALRATLPQAEFVDATHLVMEVSEVKSAEEVEVIRRCVKMTDAGGRAFVDNVREGANEREVKAEIEGAILRAGSEGYWYNFQLYSGPQVAVGMGGMTGRILARGEQVQVDCGAVFKGYRGDFSRVTTVGPPAPEMLKVMETTAEMYDAMLAILRPGLPVAEMARAGMEAARKRGMEEYFYRSPNPPSDKPGFMGHGMSCWTHGYPSIEPDSKEILKPNMVIVFEPILGQPGVGGAKIEDSVLVTETGAERMSEIDIRVWPQ